MTIREGGAMDEVTFTQETGFIIEIGVPGKQVFRTAKGDFEITAFRAKVVLETGEMIEVESPKSIREAREEAAARNATGKPFNE